MSSQCTVVYVLLSIAMMMVGCSDSTSEAQNPIPNVQNANAQSPNSTKPIEQGNTTISPPFTYSSVGKRDPFRSYLIDLDNENKARNFGRKLEETESYELDQYHLGGLITGISQPKAMLEDPSGHGYVIHVGSRVGKNGGVVTQIDTQGVLVIEETHDPLGKLVRLPIRIRLPQTDYEDIGNR